MRRWVILLGVVVVAAVVFFQVGKPKKPVTPEVPPAPPSPQMIQYTEAMKLSDTNPEQGVAALQELIEQYPEDEVAPRALFQTAMIYQKQKQPAEQRRVLEELRQRYPNSDAARQGTQVLWQMNIDNLFSPQINEQSLMHEVQPGDTLFKIAQQYGTTVELISRINNLSSSVIRQGKKLKIPTNTFSIYVDKTSQVLTLSDQNGVIKEYPIGIGANNSTPVGMFKIVNRIADPVWYKTGAIVPSGSEENILGTRWLGISEPGYGIHGTTDDSPIQSQKTQGCVRMRNSDVEELFDIVPVDTTVEIVD